MADNTRKYCFVVEKQGIRLDRYAGESCPELTRTQAQKLIAEGYIKVNNSPAKASLKLDIGDKVTVTIPPATASELLPEDIPFGILYEDDDLLVIDKPAGLTVHPAPGHPEHNLVNAVLSHLSSLPDAADASRPGIVHRLDKDTSGVMLVAKNNMAQANLSDQFKKHAVMKVYLALVKGRMGTEEGIIEAPIGRDPRYRKRMAIASESRGRPARTHYRVVRYIDGYTLLEVMPQTGRTHQIRVHLSAIGYPVVGDATYGIKSPYLPRQFLHASRLGFRLPSSGEYAEFKSELPPDLQQALNDIG